MEENRCDYQELSHTAEVGIRVRADSPAALYACAAQAMFALLEAGEDPAETPTPRTVTVESMDPESLLVDWLNELLFLYETTGQVFTQCQVTKWSPTRLEATVYGRTPTRPPRFDIKAVTYHDLQVGQDEEGWFAQVIFDI